MTKQGRDKTVGWMFDDLFEEVKKLIIPRVSVNEVVVCPDCDGLGYYVNGIYTPECKHCDGTGQTDC